MVTPLESAMFKENAIIFSKAKQYFFNRAMQNKGRMHLVNWFLFSILVASGRLR